MDERIKRIIDRSNFSVFFGGAGVSTESSIPDFRSEDGLYAAQKEYGYAPEEIISHSFFIRNPETFYRYYKKHMLYPNAEPNPAHYALARLESENKLKAVITQNIDGLHQKAGSKNVYELHGSVLRNYCMNCNAKYDLDFIVESNDVPKCTKCGHTVRPDVVLYEEALNPTILTQAVDAISKADTLIVGGTSLVVYPAAGLLNYFNGDNLILINKSTTPYDSRATLAIHDSIGITLGD